MHASSHHTCNIFTANVFLMSATMYSLRTMLLKIVCVALAIACISAQATLPDVGACQYVTYVYNGCNEKPSSKPIDCQDVKRYGDVTTTTGVYTINPRDTDGFQVRCDMTTSGDGWTVIQRRIGDSDFYKNWVEYQKGFGDLTTNFWLGNDKIHSITSQGVYELRVDMIGPADEVKYAQYKVFTIGDAGSKYKLLIGEYSGDAGDSLTDLNGMKFTTKDKDNDVWNKNCAVDFTAAWWYKACHLSNPNGLYGSVEFGKGINWQTFTTHNKSLKQVEMKIRRWSV